MYEGLEELQRRLLEMLAVFSEFAKENGIKVFLVGGSALGAYRHGGFIPWDDDIDVAMMRSDFEKMEHLMRNKNNKLGEFLYSPVEQHIIPDAPIAYLYDTLHAQNGYENTAKIDIHPIDGVPRGRVLRNIQYLCSLIYYLSIYRNPVKNKGKAARLVSKVILKCTPNKLFTFYLWISKKIITLWDWRKSSDICSLFGVAGYRQEIMPRDYLIPLKSVYFEGEKFLFPGKIESYLERLYGLDYVELPPEKEQKPRHKIYQSYAIQNEKKE
ncbi:MAG: LicD family protein [Lachnospiraceae bacterium]|nr:LicD family protein [Lachnospiraceae bacterium]